MIVKDVPFTLIVEPAAPAPDFFPSVNPASATVAEGATASFEVRLNAANGFHGAANLSVLNLPAGATAAFTRNPIDYILGCTVTITTAGVAAGTYTPVLHAEEVV